MPEETQGIPDAPREAPEGAAPQDAPGIFDERFRTFMEGFGEACEREGAQLALAVVVDPQQPKNPMVFLRGGAYELALLAKEMLDRLREEVARELA